VKALRWVPTDANGWRWELWRGRRWVGRVMRRVGWIDVIKLKGNRAVIVPVRSMQAGARLLARD
jgi:Holliday junction resolvase-like predicted endonuclease